MKRVFIIGASKFPRGSAGANYDQYVALALMEQGYKVFILGKGDNRQEDFDGTNFVYKDIIYENEKDTNIVKYGISLKFYKKMVEKYHITQNDDFIIRDLGWLPQLWMAKKFGTKRMTYVHFEDLRPQQFKFAYINPQYWCFQLKWGFKLRHIHHAFPISEALENIEKKYNCNTLRLPIMADPDEFGEAIKYSKGEKIKFIYPGAKLNGCEDDVVLMLEALSALSDDELSKTELHITGTTKEKLSNRLKEKSKILDKLEAVIVIHSWMDYSELINLYRNMDFLLLCRYNNPVTLANFPSKVPETLSFGIVPVCSNVGDYTKYFLKNEEDSLIFDPNSVSACVAVVRRIIGMSDFEYLELRKHARNTAVTRFGYKNWSKEISDFIQKR